MDELQILYGRGIGTNVISKFYACRRFCCSVTILDCHKIARETSCNAHFLLLCWDEYFFLFEKKTVHSLILLYNLTYLIPRKREKIPFHFVKLSFKSIADVNEKIFSTRLCFLWKQQKQLQQTLWKMMRNWIINAIFVCEITNLLWSILIKMNFKSGSIDECKQNQQIN